MLYIPKKYPHLLKPHPRTSGVRVVELGLFFLLYKEHVRNHEHSKTENDIADSIECINHIISEQASKNRCVYTEYFA